MPAKRNAPSAEVPSLKKLWVLSAFAWAVPLLPPAAPAAPAAPPARKISKDRQQLQFHRYRTPDLIVFRIQNFDDDRIPGFKSRIFKIYLGLEPHPGSNFPLIRDTYVLPPRREEIISSLEPVKTHLGKNQRVFAQFPVKV